MQWYNKIEVREMKRKKMLLVFMMFFAVGALVACADQTTESTTIESTTVESTTLEPTTEEPTTEQVQIEDLVLDQMADVHRLNTIYIEDGKVYTKGENKNGQLGAGDFVEHQGFVEITDAFALTDDQIISVALGEYHALALSGKGQVFAWGHNAYGKLGLPSGSNHSLPVNITNEFNLNVDEQIIYIAVGRDHNAVITSEGRVFTWGVNAYGQLGTGEKNNPWEETIYMPQDITQAFDLADDDFIIKIELGNNHSMALSYLGQVFVWGSNEVGQLGVEDEEVLVPTKITHIFSVSPETIIDISVGYNHSGVLSSNNRVFVFGDNMFNQLGVTDLTHSSEPLEISDAVNGVGNIVKLNFNHDSSAVIGQTGTYVFGYNFNYQLGLENNALVQIPTLLVNQAFKDQTIIDMVIAKEVYLVIYEDGSFESYGPF